MELAAAHQHPHAKALNKRATELVFLPWLLAEMINFLYGFSSFRFPKH
jgi:hypothetical protein